jgi:FkbM family methyltransferase
MKKILHAFIQLTAKVAGRKNMEKLLIYSAKSIDTDLLKHAQIQVGGSGSVGQNNGENIFIESILPCLLNDSASAIVFDVGANVGNYSLAVRKRFPQVSIHSFEPVKKTFDLLVRNTVNDNISTYNLGFSDTRGVGKIFNTVNSEDTEIASLYQDVFSDIFKSEAEITSDEFSMDTIDEFCSANNIGGIDFLKIDVEGHELFVLKGAAQMIKNDHLKIVQFEFNAHNVYSRVFLRDFYLILENFEFYPMNELFIQQNLVAVRKDLGHLIPPSSLKTLSA